MQTNMQNNTKQEVEIPLDSVIHKGNLMVPGAAKGLVLFAHGSGSSRLSPRNQYVARVLNNGGIATLLFDLLTEVEDRVYETRFDIELLTRRLLLASEWAKQQEVLVGLPMGYFGASTGAAAALKAAARANKDKDKEKVFGVCVVVSRGGRPDLAGADLPEVTAATVLIVGGRDDLVIELNHQAYENLHCKKSLKIVPGATHLFEEAGALEEVAHLANNWFERYLCE